MKSNHNDYIKLVIFIIQSVASATLFYASFLNPNGDSLMAIYAIMLAFGAMFSSSSLTDIWLNNMFQKATKPSNVNFDGKLNKLECYKVDIGQFFAGTVLVTLLFTIPSIFSKNWLLTTAFVVIASLSLLLVLINAKYFKDYLYSHLQISQVNKPQNSP